MNNKISFNPILRKFKREVKQVNKDNFKRIILFGSYAREEQKKGSDIDLILIFKKEPTSKIKSKIREISNSLSLQHNIVITEFLFTESEFNKYKTPFLLNVKKEGIII